VLDELVGRLSYVESRLVEGAEQERFRRWMEGLLGEGLKTLGWEAAAGESDRVKLRRAALVRAVGGVARSPEALAEARPRVARMLEGDTKALEPNLLDVAVAMVARSGDRSLYEKLLEKMPGEPDPATQRRYLMALTAFEDPALADAAQKLFFSEKVKMQDVASFTSGLMGNRTGREAWWAEKQKRWKDVLARTGGAPMLLRRMVESIGALRERKQLDEVRKLLMAHPVEEAKQAMGQTLEKLEQDVVLRERALPEVSAWLKRHP
jgi:puromycin-sensitive aminopeptidase